MKTLLVIAPQAGFADAIRAMVDAQQFRVLHYRTAGEAEPALAQGLVDACLYDSDLLSVEPIRTIETLRRRAPQAPILVFAGARQWEWEEEACLQGAAQVLTKPIRAPMLNLLLARLLPASGPSPGVPLPLARPSVLPPPGSALPPAASAEPLGVLRSFSAILTHSLQAEPLLRQFLLLLREILGINRAAVYLRPPPGALHEPAAPAAGSRLSAACAIGLPAELLGHIDLTLQAGIGAHLLRHGRILRCESPEVQRDPGMQKEFELLGAQVAVPILDRENLIGVALFDGRVTGEPLQNTELGLIFHLLEEVGLAIRNIWLHDQVVASNAMMGDILHQLRSACLVVGWDLAVLHANQAARACFGRPERKGFPLEFTDLPQVLGGKVFEVLKTGQEVRAFHYRSDQPEPRSFRVSITPFRKQEASAPTAALVLVDDCTDEERLHALQVEAANLRLVKVMAERLSHEVGNAIVPLSTHQQLFAEKKDDPEFVKSLETALDDGVRRVSRLASQMLYLARDLPARVDTVALEQLVRDAFKDAQRHQPEPRQMLRFESAGQAVTLQGDRSGLKHALYEILLNALQASPRDATVSVRSNTRRDDQGMNWLDIEIKDAGSGFSPQSAQHAAEPFFTTRNVGLGLGLTVCRKIVETHRGRLEIEPPGPENAGLVRVSLPLHQPSAPAPPR